MSVSHVTMNTFKWMWTQVETPMRNWFQCVIRGTRLAHVIKLSNECKLHVIALRYSRRFEYTSISPALRMYIFLCNASPSLPPRRPPTAPLRETNAYLWKLTIAIVRRLNVSSVWEEKHGSKIISVRISRKKSERKLPARQRINSINLLLIFPAWS